MSEALSQKANPSTFRNSFIALTVFGFVERLLFWHFYQPVFYADSHSYLRISEAISDWNLDGYDGTRMPGYPIFLALMGQEADTIWIAQMILGWLISLMLFWIAWRCLKNAYLAAILGGAYNLLAGQVLFEANLLAETLTTFLILLVFTLLVEFQQRGYGVIQNFLALCLGSASGLVAYVRPLFFVLPLCLLPLIWFTGGSSLRESFLRTAAFSMAPILLLGGWLVYMSMTFHVTAPTAMSGYHLVQHSGVFFEYLSDEDAVIRDTYLKYRAEQLATRGSQANTIWDAIPELQEVSGLGFYDLSREMQRLSLKLIRKHPDLYLKNMIKGWIDFWKAPVYWRPEAIAEIGLRRVISAWAAVGRLVSIIANGLFLGLTSLQLLWPRAKERYPFSPSMWASAGLIWVTSIVQTIFDHGDNPRFLVPLQMLILLVVIRSFQLLRQSRQRGSLGIG